eukprot:gene42708-52185_t
MTPSATEDGGLAVMDQKYAAVTTEQFNFDFFEWQGTEVKTGWYLPECAHPYHRFSKAGYAIDFASINGGACPVTPA